ncbi:hypothetical protein [Actinomadura parmotrematis]|uniref:Uncharacterized protein n=1 Tax=Actinomadura parmotrematis TaxID=2864039 RepID=A0ABS7FQ96_9ACTN|nr:hypothetical protein [Actinomadura parmotrematis]MBW8482567.1 hypothetical protein [Actinomadura parmotrematis]
MTPPLPAGEGVLATHSVVSAIPFFVPTFVVVAVIAVIVWRDRHRDDEDESAQDVEDEEERPGVSG